MPVSELMQLIEAADYDAFEARCLELLELGDLQPADVMPPFEHLERAGEGKRVATLAQMIMENVAATVAPEGLLPVARAALTGAPADEGLLNLTVDLYRRVYGELPGFERILEASGLMSGRAVRSALRVLDIGLTLKQGDTLLCRMDDRALETTEIDRQNGLFTLRREGRATTIPVAELARDYDPIDPDDFRVLRQLRPERLAELIESDPVALVIGLIRAHGDHIDQDRLKSELVPRHIDFNGWSKWWTKTRAKLKRCPNVIMEGRTPVFLSYCAEGRTPEDEAQSKIEADADPMRWLAVMEEYLKEQSQRKQPPEPALVERFHAHVVRHIEAIRARRPAEALACALVLGRLTERGFPSTEETEGLARAMLRDAAEPATLIAGLEHDALWTRALKALSEARPDDAAAQVVTLMPQARATVLDRIVAMGMQAGLGAAVQEHVDTALDDPVDYGELVYWLWKGPRAHEGLRLPTADVLLARILDTLSALGRTLVPDATLIKSFRLRMKNALGLRDFRLVRECLARTDVARAVTIRGQLRRMDGLGDNMPAQMLDMLRKVHPDLWARQEARLAPWEDTNVLWTTQAGLEKRTAERDELVNVKMPENAKKIGEAAAHGDLSENSEYRFALEERDLLRARLAQINAELSQARVLEQHDLPRDHVGVGSRVTLRNVADGSTKVMTFLGSFDTDVDRDIFNYRAPVSQKLMGLRVGERVTLTLDGRECELAITDIVNRLG
ncbi:MAG: GreA/GreB family elongation factor [Planctomycetes bacterium]|nr:GreA/GreB family elongation factor [Planctomycetota bacterium]